MPVFIGAKERREVFLENMEQTFQRGDVVIKYYHIIYPVLRFRRYTPEKKHPNGTTKKYKIIVIIYMRFHHLMHHRHYTFYAPVLV